MTINDGYGRWSASYSIGATYNDKVSVDGYQPHWIDFKSSLAQKEKPTDELLSKVTDELYFKDVWKNGAYRESFSLLRKYWYGWRGKESLKGHEIITLLDQILEE